MTPDIRPVIEALTAYVEHRTELNAMLDAYDGYSPDYHFSAQIARRDQLERKAGEALSAFVVSVMSANWPSVPRADD